MSRTYHLNILGYDEGLSWASQEVVKGMKTREEDEGELIVSFAFLILQRTADLRASKIHVACSRHLSAARD